MSPKRIKETAPSTFNTIDATTLANVIGGGVSAADFANYKLGRQRGLDAGLNPADALTAGMAWVHQGRRAGGVLPNY
jgi:hypothetical protein